MTDKFLSIESTSQKINHRNSCIPKAVPVILLCLLLYSGCQDNTNQWRSQIDQLTSEKAALNSQIQSVDAENRTLKQQVQNLSGLPEQIEPEEVFALVDVKIHRYSNFSDKDNDGIKDTLIVYIQPVDQQSDVVKAVGTVDVQLWDLNNPDGQAMLKEWVVTPEELKELWYNTLITTTFRLTFDISSIVTDFTKDYTVKLTFTESITGKVFTAQRVIEP